MILSADRTVTPETPGDWYSYGSLVLAGTEAILAAPWVHADAARKAADALAEALEKYDAIDRDLIHETSWYPVAREAEPKHEALRLAAEEIADWVNVLTVALPAAQGAAEGKAA
jgi:hypothetical protein